MLYPRRIETIDTHTDGEPTRVITNWIKDIPGASTFEKMLFFKDHYDHVRTAIIQEPRGHRDMYGCLLTNPSREGSDYGIIFMDNSGYMNMCGHGTIGVATVIAEQGLAEVTEPITKIVLEPPAGSIIANIKMKNGRAESVSFVGIPSFVEELDVDLDVPDIGKIKVDIVFGGNYFVFYSAKDLNVTLASENIDIIIKASMKILEAANKQYTVRHPTLTNNNHINIASTLSEPRNPKAQYLNVHVFSNRQYDRSPGGTATCARMAALHAKGQLKVGEDIYVESLTGGLFKGKILSTTMVGNKKAIIPEITGTAFITGFHQFIIHPDDLLGKGFLL